MCAKSDKVVKMLKIALRAGTPAESHAGVANASVFALKNGLDFFALLARAQRELGMEAHDAQPEAEPKRETRSQDVRQEPTWNDVSREVTYHAGTMYDPRDERKQALLAQAVRDVLKAAGFTYSRVHGKRGETKEEVWDKVVGRAPNGDEVRVWVFTSIIEGRTDAQGARVGGRVRGLGTDQIRICAKGVTSRSRGGRKGHTVKRVGRFGSWTEGRDHRHNNNPGILGRIYREVLNVTDAALAQAAATKTAEDAQSAESAREFVLRMVRDYENELRKMPHPARFRAKNGESMWDYVGWVMNDSRNQRDRSGNCRFEFARERIESFL
jgi:hypothetical protein